MIIKEQNRIIRIRVTLPPRRSQVAGSRPSSLFWFQTFESFGAPQLLPTPHQTMAVLFVLVCPVQHPIYPLHAMPPPKLSHIYRGLLKLTKTPQLAPHLAKKGPPPNNPASSYLRQQLQQTSPPSSRRLAQNLLRLKQELYERQRLYTLDSGAEVVLSPKEQSRRAAARAGLQLPKLDPDLK